MTDPTPIIIIATFLGSALVASAIVLRKTLAGPSANPPQLPGGSVTTWWYQPIDLLGISIITSIFFILICLSFAVPAVNSQSITADALIISIGFQVFIAAIAAAFALQRASLSSWLGLHWPQWGRVILIAPACVGAMWFLFYIIDKVGYMKWMESLGVERLQDTVQILQESNNPVIIFLMVVTAVIVAPICEEVVFRGYIYPVLKKYTGLWSALIISSLVFSAAHGHLAVLLPLFILGALLVVVYERTNSIWASIAVHFCFNGATVAIQLSLRFFDIPIEADL